MAVAVTVAVADDADLHKGAAADDRDRVRVVVAQVEVLRALQQNRTLAAVARQTHRHRCWPSIRARHSIVRHDVTVSQAWRRLRCLLGMLCPT